MDTDRPRIAQFIPTLSLGGATLTVIELATRLRATGHGVEIITGSDLEAGHSMLERAQGLGIPVHVIGSLRRRPHPIHDFRALLELSARLRTGRFDIAHCHGTKGILLGSLAARRARIPATVWHAHGWGFHDRSTALARMAIIAAHRTVARHATRIVAVSEATRRTGLTNRIGREENYRLIYEAADIERFGTPPLSMSDARERLGIDPSVLVVGSLTRLSPQKAPLDFVDVAALVLAEEPGVHFCIAGDGPLAEATTARIRARGIEDGVTLLGARSDGPEVVAAFDIFALTSLWEGLPICYLEAMAMGKPVVGTDAGGGLPRRFWMARPGSAPREATSAQ